MSAPVFPTFGQEFYLRETLEAARLLDGPGAERGGSPVVEAMLTHPSPSTRRRVASKMLQRLQGGLKGREARVRFVRLLSRLPDSEARRELVYYATSVADPIVGAVARDVLYPFFVEGNPPLGAKPEDVAPHRDGLLLTVEPVITLRFLLQYAERRWAYRSERCVRLALRILQQAEIVFAQRERGAFGRVTGYLPAPHGLSLATFVWCFHVELARSVPPPSEDRALRADFARTLVASPAVVRARMQQAEREGYIRQAHGPGGRRILAASSLDEAIERLTAP